MNRKKTIPRHIIIKLLKTDNFGKILRQEERKNKSTYRKTKIRMTADFL